MPVINRTSVVFPHPLGPMNPTIEPTGTSKVTFEMTVSPVNDFEAFVAETADEWLSRAPPPRPFAGACRALFTHYQPKPP